MRFIPVTPGGTVLFELESDSENRAWEKLQAAASHMPYKTRENFIKRGYTIETTED